MNITSKRTKAIRVVALILIPVFIFVYIGYVNLLPFGGRGTYFIDIGSEDDIGNARLVGPFNRISEKLEAGSISYRELEDWGVYFELASPGIGSFEEISVKVRFRDNFPPDQTFMLGARDKIEWSYDWKKIYIPLYQQLSDLDLIAESDSIKLFRIHDGSSTYFSSVSDFLSDPPAYSSVITNNPSLVDQHLSPDEWSVLLDQFISEQSTAPVIINSDLRGEHTFWTYVDNGVLRLSLIKQDLNWYLGADELILSIYSLDDDLIWSTSIVDDGTQTNSKELGPLQTNSLNLAGLNEGAYRIEITGGNDFLISRIEVNQEKFVIAENVYWAGGNDIYFGQLPDPESMYFISTGQEEVVFSTAHDSGLQTLDITNQDFSANIDLDAANTLYDVSLQAGVYQIASDKQNVVAQSDGYFAFSPQHFFIPKKCEVLDLKYDLDWILSNGDYIVIDYGDYREPEVDGQWLIATAKWNREDVNIIGNKLNFSFNAPHFNNDEFEHMTIPIDWVEIQVSTPSILGR